MFDFRLIKSAGPAGPRLGQITTARGVIDTPVFMPVGTYATVKTLTPEDLQDIGRYHLEQHLPSVPAARGSHH